MSKFFFQKETIRIKRRKETVWFVFAHIFAHGLKFGEVKGKPILIQNNQFLKFELYRTNMSMTQVRGLSVSVITQIVNNNTEDDKQTISADIKYEGLKMNNEQ